MKGKRKIFVKSFSEMINENEISTREKKYALHKDAAIEWTETVKSIMAPGKSEKAIVDKLAAYFRWNNEMSMRVTIWSNPKNIETAPSWLDTEVVNRALDLLRNSEMYKKHKAERLAKKAEEETASKEKSKAPTVHVVAIAMKKALDKGDIDQSQYESALDVLNMDPVPDDAK
jgi:hypothetical protein